MYLCLTACQSVSPSLSVFVFLSACLPISLSVSGSVTVSVSLHIRTLNLDYLSVQSDCDVLIVEVFALLQLAAALRNLADTSSGRDRFITHNVVEGLAQLMESYPGDSDLMLYISRIFRLLPAKILPLSLSLSLSEFLSLSPFISLSLLGCLKSPCRYFFSLLICQRENDTCIKHLRPSRTS